MQISISGFTLSTPAFQGIMNIINSANFLKKISISTLKIASIVAVSSLFPELANAATVGISSYDVTNTPISGFGGWLHQYNGTITNNGSGSYNYSGGSGTLNDGLVGTSVSNTHLFTADLFAMRYKSSS